MRQAQAEQAAREAFGAQVRQFRAVRGWDMDTLARHVGKSASTMNRIETGKVNVRIYDIQVLARALHVPVSALLDPASSADGAARLVQAHLALCAHRGQEALTLLQSLVQQLEGLAG